MSTAQVTQRFNIAILALGGQGGGVLVDWLVRLAQSQGWLAQATSVAGVAQRTGATIYYVEIMQLAQAQTQPHAAPLPVMALMPVPGSVDIVIAAELMEAGRALERGLITADRTTVIASSHRTFAVNEKTALTSGISNSAEVLRLVQAAAKHVVCDDMQTLALQQGSVISSALFGALAGSAALPFDLAAFEQVIQDSGVGVGPSLKALRAAAASVQEKGSIAPDTLAHDPMRTAARPLPLRAPNPTMQTLLERIRRDFPEAAWDMLGEGVARCADYQDPAYAHSYLDQALDLLRAAQQAIPASDAHHAAFIPAFANALAQWLAVAMSYDDVIRVADLKIRLERSQRIRQEVSAKPDAVVGTEDYFHPRLEEVLSLLRPSTAAWVQRQTWLCRWIEKQFCQGQRIASHTLWGYQRLRFLASLRARRTHSLRHQHEMQHIATWLKAVQQCLTPDPQLALELVHCRRLIKGYGDTHARGSHRFDRLLQAALALRGQTQAASQLAQLRNAAFQEKSGQALSQALQTLGLEDVAALS